MTPSWFPPSVVVATHNPGKLAEWRHLLHPHGTLVRTPDDFLLTEPEETEPDYVGNAILKAQAAARITGVAALADDTGFEADALEGQPGVFTARWATKHGGYPSATRTLLQEAGAGSRARLVCAVALVDGTQVRSARAEIAGTLCSAFTEAPGFAAILEPDAGRPMLVGGVLAHRRAAFEQLLAGPLLADQ